MPFALIAESLAGFNRNDVARISDDDQTYWVEQVATDLSFPSSMVWLPDGDVLIAERIGGLRILRGGRRLDRAPISGVPVSYQGRNDGIKDIVLDPDYQHNRHLYLFISEGTFDSRHAAVYRARYNSEGLTEVVRIFRSNEEVGGMLTFVSRMMFLSDNTLLLAVAEDHAQKRAQQLGSHMGKILRIRRDGTVPEDNPFVGVPNALPEIWSYGHRVPLGLYQDPDSGVIWEVEPGPRGGDELNILKPGANYGWANASWGFAYLNKGLEAPIQSGPGIEDPVWVWMPSTTPAGITRYRGSTYPRWNGDYFIGSLSGKALMRLRIQDRQVLLQERMLLDLDERIREVKVGPDHHLYLLTDHQNGRLLRLRSGQPEQSDMGRIAHKLEHPIRTVDDPMFAGGEEQIANMTPTELAQGKRLFLEQCATCHSVGSSVRGGGIGPDLAGVYDNFMGRKPDFDYSPSMAGGLIQWKFAMLDRFLMSPRDVVPGTKMIAPPMTDVETRRKLIGFLKSSPQSDGSPGVANR